MSKNEIPVTPVRRKPNLRRFAPKLPDPAQAKTSARISYLVEITELDEVVDRFYEDKKVSNADVGKMTFGMALKEARKSS